VTQYRLAILLPCYNEQATIGKVIDDFRRALPEATVYVYDNNSTDATQVIALEHGAVVRCETRQGKGSVVRRMFADIDADVYVIADGDDTYQASAASDLVKRLLDDHLDMVVAAREGGVNVYRQGHYFGNRLFNKLVDVLFGSTLTDIFSGYRVFSKRFVKSFPKSSTGFEIEIDLSVHALELKLPIAEVPVPYGVRPEGSTSKLRTFRDGYKIFRRAMILFKEVRPFYFYLIPSMAFAVAAGILLMYSLAVNWIMLSILLSFVCFISGLILDSIARMRREMKRMFYNLYTAL
jgi:glycosyltransferase involved in cell wall biosynthesis